MVIVLQAGRRGEADDGYTFVFGKQPNIPLWAVFYTLYHMISGGKWDGARISIVWVVNLLLTPILRL